MVSSSRVFLLVLWMVLGDNELEFAEIFRLKFKVFEVVRVGVYGGLLQLFV